MSNEHPQYEHTRRIIGAGRQAAKLAGKLLSFSRDQVSNGAITDLNRELERLLHGVVKQAGHGIRVVSDLETALWPVSIDVAQLQQILSVLVSNSCDAMEGQGRIAVGAKNIVVDSSTMAMYPNLAEGEWLELSVTDTGPGIPAEVMDHIYEPFFTTKPHGTGSGLGLATLFGIVKQHNGQIIASNCDEGGVCFSIYLKRAEESKESGGDTGPKGGDLRGNESILVVEDDTEVRNLVRAILEDYGYTVDCAHNGAEAILLYEESGKVYDLLLTDVIMPGMNGKVLADEILRRHSEARIMFMSGYTDGTVGQYGVLQKAENFIQKPFSPSQFAAKIRMVLNSGE